MNCKATTGGPTLALLPTMTKTNKLALLTPASLFCLVMSSVGCVDAADDDMANPDETDKNGGASFWIKSNKASEPRTFECNEYFSCDIRIVAEKFTPHSDTGKLLGVLKWKRGRAAGLGSTGRMLFDNDDLQSMVTSGYDEENWVLPTLGPNDAFTVFYEPTAEEAALPANGIEFRVTVEWY